VRTQILSKFDLITRAKATSFEENNSETKEARLHFLVMKESRRDKGDLKCSLQY